MKDTQNRGGCLYFLPLFIAVLIALVINVYPIYLAYMDPERYGVVGWMFYFYTIPAAVVILLVGWLFSVVLLKSLSEPRLPRTKFFIALLFAVGLLLWSVWLFYQFLRVTG